MLPVDFSRLPVTTAREGKKTKLTRVLEGGPSQRHPGQSLKAAAAATAAGTVAKRKATRKAYTKKNAEKNAEKFKEDPIYAELIKLKPYKGVLDTRTKSINLDGLSGTVTDHFYTEYEAFNLIESITKLREYIYNHSGSHPPTDSYNDILAKLRAEKKRLDDEANEKLAKETQREKDIQQKLEAASLEGRVTIAFTEYDLMTKQTISAEGESMLIYDYLKLIDGKYYFAIPISEIKTPPILWMYDEKTKNMFILTFLRVKTLNAASPLPYERPLIRNGYVLFQSLYYEAKQGGRNVTHITVDEIMRRGEDPVIQAAPASAVVAPASVQVASTALEQNYEQKFMKNNLRVIPYDDYNKITAIGKLLFIDKQLSSTNFIFDGKLTILEEFYLAIVKMKCMLKELPDAITSLEGGAKTDRKSVQKQKTAQSIAALERKTAKHKTATAVNEAKAARALMQSKVLGILEEEKYSTVDEIIDSTNENETVPLERTPLTPVPSVVPTSDKDDPFDLDCNNPKLSIAIEVIQSELTDNINFALASIPSPAQLKDLVAVEAEALSNDADYTAFINQESNTDSNYPVDGNIIDRAKAYADLRDAGGAHPNPDYQYSYMRAVRVMLQALMDLDECHDIPDSGIAFIEQQRANFLSSNEFWVDLPIKSKVSGKTLLDNPGSVLTGKELYEQLTAETIDALGGGIFQQDVIRKRMRAVADTVYDTLESIDKEINVPTYHDAYDRPIFLRSPNWDQEVFETMIYQPEIDTDGNPKLDTKGKPVLKKVKVRGFNELLERLSGKELYLEAVDFSFEKEFIKENFKLSADKQITFILQGFTNDKDAASSPTYNLFLELYKEVNDSVGGTLRPLSQFLKYHLLPPENNTTALFSGDTDVPRQQAYPITLACTNDEEALLKTWKPIGTKRDEAPCPMHFGGTSVVSYFQNYDPGVPKYGGTRLFSFAKYTGTKTLAGLQDLVRLHTSTDGKIAPMSVNFALVLMGMGEDKVGKGRGTVGGKQKIPKLHTFFQPSPIGATAPSTTVINQVEYSVFENTDNQKVARIIKPNADAAQLFMLFYTMYILSLDMSLTEVAAAIGDTAISANNGVAIIKSSMPPHVDATIAAQKKLTMVYIHKNAERLTIAVNQLFRNVCLVLNSGLMYSNDPAVFIGALTAMKELNPQNFKGLVIPALTEDAFLAFPKGGLGTYIQNQVHIWTASNLYTANLDRINGIFKTLGSVRPVGRQLKERLFIIMENFNAIKKILGDSGDDNLVGLLVVRGLLTNFTGDAANERTIETLVNMLQEYTDETKMAALRIVSNSVEQNGLIDAGLKIVGILLGVLAKHIEIFKNGDMNATGKQSIIIGETPTTVEYSNLPFRYVVNMLFGAQPYTMPSYPSPEEYNRAEAILQASQVEGAPAEGAQVEEVQIEADNPEEAAAADIPAAVEYSQTGGADIITKNTNLVINPIRNKKIKPYKTYRKPRKNQTKKRSYSRKQYPNKIDLANI